MTVCSHAEHIVLCGWREKPVNTWRMDGASQPRNDIAKSAKYFYGGIVILH